MNTAETAQLHSLPVRPTYDWVPSDLLRESLDMDQPLFHSAAMTDDERREIFDQYPPVRGIDYKASATIPTASANMSKQLQHEDSMLKELQCLVSGVFRPLDILGYEIIESTSTLPRKLNFFWIFWRMLDNC